MTTDMPDSPDAPDEQQALQHDIKSMELFFIDNQAAWPPGTQLVGDLVVARDDGKYPSFQAVASAKHPNFDGLIITQAGNRGILVTFCAGARNAEEVRKIMSLKGRHAPEQYRIAVDAIVHRMMLWREDQAAHKVDNRVHPFALLQWLQASHPAEASVIQRALKRFYAKPEAVPFEKDGHFVTLDRQQVHEMIEPMLDQLTDVVATAPTIKSDEHAS